MSLASRARVASDTCNVSADRAPRSASSALNNRDGLECSVRSFPMAVTTIGQIAFLIGGSSFLKVNLVGLSPVAPIFLSSQDLATAGRTGGLHGLPSIRPERSVP